MRQQGSTEHPGRRERARVPLVVALSLALHLGLWLLATSVPKEVPPPPAEPPIAVSIVEAPPPPPPVVPQAAPPAPEPPRHAARKNAPPAPPARSVPQPTQDLVPDVAPPASSSSDALAESPTQAPAAGPDNGSPLPGKSQLFDPRALGATVERSRVSVPQGGGGGGVRDSDADGSPEAERTRVGRRLTGQIDRMIGLNGRVGEFGSSCDDGIDNNMDGEIDCADAGCRTLALCDFTGIYANRTLRDIPDANENGVASIIEVKQAGAVRKVALQIDVLHAHPGDLTVVLEREGTELHAVLHEADRHDGVFPRHFYVRAFNGMPAAGKWRLRVKDLVHGGTGVLRGWSLYVTS